MNDDIMSSFSTTKISLLINLVRQSFTFCSVFYKNLVSTHLFYFLRQISTLNFNLKLLIQQNYSENCLKTKIAHKKHKYTYIRYHSLALTRIKERRSPAKFASERDVSTPNRSSK